MVSHLQPEFSGTQDSVFCGLFSPSLSRRCWVSDEVLAVSCPQGETMRPVLINISSGEVTMPGHETCLNVEILDVHDNMILAKHSDPVTPPALVIASLSSSLSSLQFQQIKQSVSPCPVPGLTWRSFSFNPGNIFTAHYVGPKYVVTTDYKDRISPYFLCSTVKTPKMAH